MGRLSAHCSAHLSEAATAWRNREERHSKTPAQAANITDALLDRLAALERNPDLFITETVGAAISVFIEK